METNLRLFLDTNILLDLVDGYEGNCSKELIDVAVNLDYPKISLLTSEFVLQEAFEVAKQNRYIGTMVAQPGWSFKRAHRGIRNFDKIDIGDLASQGQEIQNDLNRIMEEILVVDKLFAASAEDYDYVGFLQARSRITHKDAVILRDALISESHFFVTCDSAIKKGMLELISEIQWNKEINVVVPDELLTPDKQHIRQQVLGEHLRTFGPQVGTILNFYRDCSVAQLEVCEPLVNGDSLIILQETGPFEFRVDGMRLNGEEVDRVDTGNVTVKTPQATSRGAAVLKMED